MAVVDEVLEVLRQLPEHRTKEVLDFARFLRVQESGRSGPAALTDEELEAIIAEEEALWASLPAPPPGTPPYRFHREEVYEERLRKLLHRPPCPGEGD